MTSSSTKCGLTLRCVMYSCSVASPLKLKLVSCSTSALCAVLGDGVGGGRERAKSFRCEL